MKHNNTILDEAKDIIYGDREKTYGHPAKNLALIAGLWTEYLASIQDDDGIATLSNKDVCMMMILLKVARQANGYTRDNLVDICGYAALNSRVEDGQ